MKAGKIAEQEDNPSKREKWFYEQRAYPLKGIPSGAFARAAQRAVGMQRARRLALGEAGAEAITASPTMWTSIGPTPTNSGSTAVGLVSGRVSAVAVDPRNADVVYVGGAQGGIWKTTNGGVTWTSIADAEITLAVGSITFDPSNPDIVYVGTGEQVFSGDSYYGAGILKSTNGGMTWAHIPGTVIGVAGVNSFVGPFSTGFTGGARIGTLAVNPSNSQMILAGVQIFSTDNTSGLYCSDDGGMTWRNIVPGVTGTEVVFVSGGSTAYAALSSTGQDTQTGIYKSTNTNQPCTAQLWTRVAGPGTSQLPQTNVGRIEIAAAPSAPNTLYAGIQNSSSTSFGQLLGFFKSTDGGQNWSQLTGTPDYCSPQCWYDHVIRVHPNDPNVVYVGGSAVTNFLARSLDGGATWTQIRQGSNGVQPHVDQHSMAFGFSGSSAVRLYIGNDGGVWSTSVSSPTGVINWTDLNATLSLTQFYPGNSIHPSTENIGFGGTQDNNTQKYTGTLQWESVTCGDGGWTAIDPAIPSIFYSTCQEIFILRSFRDGNRGTFLIGHNGIDQNDRGAFIPPFVHDPVTSGRLYFGTFRVWRTVDFGQSWQAISPDLTGGNGVLRTIAVSASNPGVIYVASSNGRVQVTADAGSTWLDRSTGVPNRSLTQIAIHPTDPMIAYLTASGFDFGTDNPGHVFKTTNGGILWTGLSGTDVGAPAGCGVLPNAPVNDIVIDPSIAGTLYVATDVGVFFTSNDGLHWCPLATGLPRVAVFSLKLRQASRTLRAGTHGRGAWDLQLPGLADFGLRSIAPQSAAAGAVSDVTLTVDGQGFSMNSVVQWNGANRATTFINPNRLTATIPASDLAAAGIGNVSVLDPGQTPSNTNTLLFAVTGAAPTLTSISPNNAPVGSSDITLTLSGTNFNSTALVYFGALSRVPTSITPTQLIASIPASEFTTGRTVSVTVLTSPPGAGSTNSQTFTVIAPAPVNDDFANAIVINSTPFSDTKDNSGATTQAGEQGPPCTGQPSAHSLWYRFTPAQTVQATADTNGSNYDTVLSIWTGPALGSLTSVGCDDDSIAGGGASRVILTLTGGTTYHFMVSGFSSFDVGNSVFNLQAQAAGDFSLSASPNAVTVTRGQSGTSTITVTGLSGFASAVALTCAGLPALSSCVFNPASVTPGAAPVTSALTITTTAGSAAPPGLMRWNPPRGWEWMVTLFVLLWVLWSMKSRRPVRMAGIAATIAVLLLVLQIACGGGGGGGGPPGGGGTPRGTFSVTISGTSGATVRTTTLTLTVN